MDNFKAILVITLVTWAAVSVIGTTPELSTTTGDIVNIPCVFGEGTLRNIFWYYNDGTGPQKILFLFKGVLAIDPEYADRASLQNDNLTLILKDIVVADEGTYRCDVDRQGQTPVPNINTKLNVFSLRPDTLPVITNQSSTLTCILPNVYPVEDTELIWYQDGKRVSYTDEVTQNDDGTADISRHIQVSKTGNFTCNATYLSANGRENTAVSILVLITPPAGKGMTSGQIAGITIGILLLVCILLAIITLTIYYLKKRGEGDSSTPQNKSGDPEQDQDVRTQLMPLSNTSNNPSTAYTSPATATTTTTIATTTETTPVTGATTSTSFPPNEGRLTSTKDFDDILEEVAKRVRKNLEIDKLGKNLGFSPEDIEGYNATNHKTQNITCDGTLQMLRDWREGQMNSTEQAALKTALEQSGQIRLADDLFTFTGDGDPSTPQNNNGDTEQDQDVTTPLMPLPNATNSPSTATPTPAAAAATTTTFTTSPDTAATTSTSNHPQKGDGDPSTPKNSNGDPEQDQDVTTPLMPLPNATNNPSTDTPTPAAAAATTTTYTTSPDTAATTSTSNQPRKGHLTSTEDFDDILEKVAKRVRKNSEIDKLGRKLGFSPEDIQGYNATNHKTQNITCDGTLQMLRDWREGQTNSTEQAALKTALEQSGKNRLADDIFSSSQ